jgi:DNA-binding CsgD family transcriptional regulator
MKGGRGVLVASSDRLFAEIVSEWLTGLGGRETTVAFDGMAALGAIGRHRPEAILVIGQLERIDAVTLAEQVARRWPHIVLIALGIHAPHASNLPRDADADALLRSLTTAAEPRVSSTPGRSDGLERLAGLTPRERRTLQLIAAGASTREIADRLGISPNTARTHAQNLYAKLGCHSRLEVVRFAAIHGLLPKPPRED